MGDTDCQPGEECRKTRKSEQPVEDLVSDIGKVDIGDRTKGDDEDQGEKGSTRFVDIGEDLRGVTCLGESGERSRTSKDTSHSDTENGEENGDVDEVVETFDVGSFEEDDKGRGLSSTPKTMLIILFDSRWLHHHR